MDEIAITLTLYYEGNVSPAELQDLQDRFADFMERHADDILDTEGAELTDYSIEVDRHDV
jgi:hypothetical protein